MTIRYFSDTDTALIDFVDTKIVETREISDTVYIDMDERGNLVSMTIEHAKASGALGELRYQELKAEEA